MLLQDACPARPIEEVRTTIAADLGKPVDALFSRLDAKALAAASIGQVGFRLLCYSLPRHLLFL
jgi:ubiquinone biosynthesis protein